MICAFLFVDASGESHKMLTFCPLCVHPDFQRMVVGKALMRRSLEIAKDMGL